MKEKFELKWISLEITPRCNLSCVHCRTNATNALKEVLTYEDIVHLIDNISLRFKPVVVLTGGEPLLRKDVFRIASYIKSKGMRVGLATNGTLLTKSFIYEIKQHIDIVSLSIDGSTAEVHDNFRQVKGAFNATIRASKMLKENNIEFLINSSFTKRNQYDIIDTYKLAKSLGAKAWYMFMVLPTGRGNGIRDELVSKKDYHKILKEHFYLELKEKEMFVRPTCAPEYYVLVDIESKNKGIDYKERSLSFSTGGAKGCIAAQKIAFIDYLGNVKPCSYFLSSAGNIFEKTFMEIWDNSNLLKQIRNFYNYNEKCAHCRYINVCGGCRVRADAFYGDYLALDPYCFV